MSTNDMNQVIMYGADWCGDCRRSKRLLDELSVDYDYVNLVDEPEQAVVAEGISGRKNIPVITFPDGSHLVEPSDPELKKKLEVSELL
ncbi:MAG: glutaredoxin family protein [Galactobacter sp.]|uniref:glutaredoxin family protein n=1 Tax=Galactobacter sp. TaxID=2676125 RepID=UPI0025BC2E3D|nr:glutaredoxin domain-containing protein [Galactobacter sp.]